MCSAALALALKTVHLWRSIWLHSWIPWTGESRLFHTAQPWLNDGCLRRATYESHLWQLASKHYQSTTVLLAPLTELRTQTLTKLPVQNVPEKIREETTKPPSQGLAGVDIASVVPLVHECKRFQILPVPMKAQRAGAQEDGASAHARASQSEQGQGSDPRATPSNLFGNTMGKLYRATIGS